MILTVTTERINMPKLTKKLVDATLPQSSKDVFVWDDEVIGFQLRVKPTGRKTYAFRYRNQYGEKKSIKIGMHGQLTTEQAKSIARKLSMQAAEGADPSQEKKQSKREPFF